MFLTIVLAILFVIFLPTILSVLAYFGMVCFLGLSFLVLKTMVAIGSIGETTGKVFSYPLEDVFKRKK